MRGSCSRGLNSRVLEYPSPRGSGKLNVPVSRVRHQGVPFGDRHEIVGHGWVRASVSQYRESMQDGQTGPVEPENALASSHKFLCVGGYTNPIQMAEAVEHDYTPGRNNVVTDCLQED